MQKRYVLLALLALGHSAGAAALSPACETLYAGGLELVQGIDRPPTPATAKPNKGVHFADPVFGTCVVRATDHAVEPPSGFARNDYSRREPFNADDSRFLVYALDGYWHVYATDTLAHVSRLHGPASDAEIQWHPSDPDLLFYTPTYGGLFVHELNVVSGQSRTVADFRGRLPWPEAERVWTRSEGSPSADGRYWGFQVDGPDWSPLGLVVWDKDTDTIVGTWDFASHGVGRPDHVSMSPSGDFIVASWDGNAYGTTAFSRDFSQQVKLHHKSEHSDLARLPNGNDAYVAVDYQSNGGDVFFVDVHTGVRTVLFQAYTTRLGPAFHFSGKAFDRPGWVLVSDYASYGGGDTPSRKIYAVELTASPRILNIAHHHSGNDGYWSEPHAAVNRDFTRILFTSNWDSGNGEDVDAYMVELPASALPSTPGGGDPGDPGDPGPGTTGAPVLTLASGGGWYPYGTTQVGFTVATDVVAECRLSTSSDTAPFGALYMTLTPSQGGLAHSFSNSAYNGMTTDHWVKCLNVATGEATAVGDDLHVQTQVAASADEQDPTPRIPVVSVVSGPGDYPYEQTTVTVVLESDIAAACRLDDQPLAFADMNTTLATTDQRRHQGSVALSGAGAHLRYARCRAVQGGLDSPVIELAFQVAEPPGDHAPVMTLDSGDGTFPRHTSSIPVSVSTDVAAECRFSTSGSQYPFAALYQTMAAGSGGRVHTYAVPVWSGASGTLYVKCRNAHSGAVTAPGDDLRVSYQVSR